ncbi:AraC family transcriptional regulator [Nocardia sp. NPDC004722]
MKPLARYAALQGYVELSRSLGIDPVSLMRAAGLDPAGLSLQDRWVPAAAIAELLERSAVESGCEDFGLRLAERRRFASLGPLSLVIREEPDVRSALRVMARHADMYNEALHTRLVEGDGLAAVRLTLDLRQPGDTCQSVELSVAVLYGLLRGFLGNDWEPVEVRFTHPAPDQTRAHRRVFGTRVAFDQDFNGILLHATDLDAPNAMSDPQLRAYAQQYLDPIRRAPATTAERVRELIELLLPTGRCSVEQVARSLGVERRTVHRRLAAEGTTFTVLLDATRLDLSGHLIANSRRSLTEVAELLGFATPGNFSRWFRQRHGRSPTEWRRDHEPDR